MHRLEATVKVFVNGSFTQHVNTFHDFDELDSFVLNVVGTSSEFEILDAESKTVFDGKAFEAALSKPKVVLHVRPMVSRGTTQKAGFMPNYAIGAPRDVRVETSKNDAQIEVKWKAPPQDNGVVLSHYRIRLVDECDGPQRQDKVVDEKDVPVDPWREPRWLVFGIRTDVTHRAEVWAVGTDSSPSESKAVRFIVPTTHTGPFLQNEDCHALTLEAELQSFCDSKQQKWPRFLVVGRQHHGKSSFINHATRCCSQKMGLLDEVESAPAGKLETTVATKEVGIRVGDNGLLGVKFLDVPAFSSMSADKVKDLRGLLWRSGNDMRRGSMGTGIWPDRPDGVVVVVSLLSFRAEPEALEEYLAVLQSVLKEGSVFPFVVAATFKDQFMQEAGNAMEDPKVALTKALQDIRKLANTDKVFAITRYRSSSSWEPCVTRDTYSLLAELTKLAANRSQEHEISACAVIGGACVSAWFEEHGIACAVVGGACVCAFAALIIAVVGDARR